ncbi:MAG: DUF805 domain-containing protein [Azospirillaceae bacterium]|nr:DUF805 domain-containing protein [Azospirillaceae bacterium]
MTGGDTTSPRDAWRSEKPPGTGAEVDFVADEDRARDIYLLALQRAPFTWPWFLLSLNGRVSRREFWLKYQVPLFILYVFVAGWFFSSIDFGAIAQGADPHASPGAVLAMTVFSLLTFWPGFAVQVKRCHDRDHSAWFLLVALIPFIGGIWLLVELWFLRGTVGDNRFGADPLA